MICLMDGLSIIIWLIDVLIAIYVIVDVWRSPAGTGFKVGWTIFAVFLSLIALIVWLITGRKRAYSSVAT
jgi:membrane protein DedA with SNARE-associated domain